MVILLLGRFNAVLVSISNWRRFGSWVNGSRIESTCACCSAATRRIGSREPAVSSGMAAK
jgi:hypothetical protein